MFLSKHKNGFYYIYYFDPLTEKRKSISSKCKTKKEALSFLTLFNQSIDRTKQNPIFPISLKKFLWEYLKYSESVHTLNTTKTFKTTFNGILNYLGEISLSRITSKNISEYLQFRRRNVSIYQARKDLINLNSAFNKAIVDKYLYSNPCEGIKRIQLPEKQPRFFSEDDLERLIRVIDNNDLIDLVGFAVNTGLRKMELIELQWE